MINYIDAHIASAWGHQIGKYTENEGVRYSDSPLMLEDQELSSKLMHYFFNKFQEPAYYTFTFSTGDIQMNPLMTIASRIFEDPQTLPEASIEVAKYLYNNSKHPNINAGDLIIALIKNVIVDDVMTQALCLFKSENKDALITLEYVQGKYDMHVNNGINTEKLDKACIIFDVDRENGYKVCAIDNSNREKEAQFWISDFLSICPRDDDYHHTKNMIHATKHFIRERMRPLYDIDKADEAFILQRSKEYFENADQFDKGTYAQKVFKEPSTVEAFNLFQEEYQHERNIPLQDSFSVNFTAVKNQSRIFKSVLKLDKNFHIYIHGNRSMIEKGTDDMGRKYYKLYYDEER